MEETDAGGLPLAVGSVVNLARYSTLGLYKTSLIYLGGTERLWRATGQKSSSFPRPFFYGI
jgi:hypothetical protein